MLVEKSILVVLISVVVLLFIAIVSLNRYYKQSKANESQLKKDLEELATNLQLRTTQAFLSPVSGLPNLLGSQARIDDVFDRLERKTIQKISVVFIDLYRFKIINDHYGHKNGDKVLKVTGKILMQSVRHSDIVVHPHGDEFVIVCADTEEEEIHEILARANTALAEYDFTFLKDGTVGTKYSYGIAESNEHLNTFEKLKNLADLKCMKRKIESGESR